MKQVAIHGNSPYRELYAPYGEPFGGTGANPADYGYTGEWTDQNDLVYLRARYYDPAIGNFISQDPLETPNRYAYVDGNPMLLTDPTGLTYTLNCPQTTNQHNPTQNNATPSRILFFGGSFPTNITVPGPDPAIQTPVWVEAINNHDVFQYPGSKLQQAEDALLYVGSDNIAIIGYSAGADAAIIFADEYLKGQRNGTLSGKITDVIVLGGTMSGEMKNGARLENQWQRIIEELLISGTDVYILNDDGSDLNDPDWGAFSIRIRRLSTIGTYTYRMTQERHYRPYGGYGTNRSMNLVTRILAWIYAE